MEYEQTPLTLDKCFLEQQAFREFLGLPLEEPLPKIRLRDLLKIAKLVIKNELVACGCSEDELLGIRLKYQLEENQPAEAYAVEWSQLIESPQTRDDKNEVPKEKSKNNLGENTHRFHETIGQLTSRLNDFSIAPERSSLTSAHFSFRNIDDLNLHIDCYLDGASDQSYYALLDQNNNFVRWYYLNGQKIGCGLEPDKSPIDFW